MRALFLAALVLGAGCFAKYKKGVVTEGTDSFSGAAEIKWDGWFKQTTAPGAGAQVALMLLGADTATDDVPVQLIATGRGQPKAKLTASFSVIASEGTSFKNESSIPWQLKGCKEVEVKAGEGEVVKLPASWDGKVTMGDPMEVMVADIPAEFLAGVESSGSFSVRMCGKVIASTEKQVDSMKQWAQKAALAPAPKPSAPVSAPSSAPSSMPAR